MPLPSPDPTDACRDLIEARFDPGQAFVGAAAMVLADGTIVVGTAPQALNPAVELCHETEPLCAAHRLDQRVVASVCLCRDESGRFLVLSPCGVCRERLAVHGPDVLVAVPSTDDPTLPRWERLRDIHLYHWATPLIDPPDAARWEPSSRASNRA